MIPASKNIRKVDQIFLIIPSNYLFRMNSKVEKILKGSLDWIPSPSPEYYGQKSLLEMYVKVKHCWVC